MVGLGWVMVWMDSTAGRDLIPVDDCKPHKLCLGCWCRPVMDGAVVSHNSMDGREAFETGARRPS